MLPLASVQSLQDQINPEDYELNPTTTPLKIAIGQNLTNLPSMWLLNHAHFINYGASYYSYILARMYSAQIWYQLLAKDPLSKYPPPISIYFLF
jgi:Zn-dependent oligopeptidase